MKKTLRPLRLCGEKIRKRWELTARFARGAENAEKKKSFLPLRPLRLCGEKIRKRWELTARFARGAENAEKKKSFLPLRPLRLCGENSSSGFSLIEVLVAMAIMVVIIVIVTNMFRDASEAWDMGTQRAEMNTSARAAVEYIARELSCAVAGSVPDSAGGTLTIKRFKLEKNATDDNVKDLSFIALSGEDRALRGIRFRYDQSGGHFIETCRKTDSDFARYDDYNWDQNPNNKDNWQGVALLIANVWRFQVIAYATENDMKTGNSSLFYDSEDVANNHSLPAAVDISLEILGERDMARALSLTPGAQQDGYVMTNSRVYTTRVCFPNRGGAR